MKKAKIFNNFGLKILAVFISVLVWLAVINVSDPVITTSYADVPVIVKNEDKVIAQGKVYEITSEKTVSISVSAKRSIQDNLSEENFRAIVDLEDYNEQDGTIPIRIESNKYGSQIESMKSKMEYATVKVEEMMRKQFLITPVVTGEPEEGFVLGTVSTAENIVRISGAQSVVSNIMRVTAEMSVTELSSDVNTSVDLKIYDFDGNIITDTNLAKNISTVAMSAQILATKELPLHFSTSGMPKDGYAVSGEFIADKETVLIAGKQTALNYLSSVDITSAAVKVDGADKDVEVEVDLTRYLPEGIVLANPEKDKMVKIKVPIDEIVEKDYEIPTTAVRMDGIEEIYDVKVVVPEDVITVKLEGFSKKVNALQIKDIQLSIDWNEYRKNNSIEQLKEGKYRVPVKVTVRDDFAKSINGLVVLAEVSEK